jgi:glutamine synthetase type III
MSEQEQYNEAVANMKLKLAPKQDFKQLLNGSKKSESFESKSYDPIANAMKRFPGLTREKAEEMATAFGF